MFTPQKECGGLLEEQDLFGSLPDKIAKGQWEPDQGRVISSYLRHGLEVNSSRIMSDSVQLL